MMDCKEISETLFRFVDNELETDLLISFQDHLEKCPPCAQRIVYTRKLLWLVRERCERCCAPNQLRVRILTSFPHRRKPIISI
jgi:mycothiol system anti-sigma-R factor